VDRSIPFVRFRVEQALASGDTGSPEGRDRTLEQLRPVFATLAPSAMRLELTRMVAGALDLPESLAEQLLSETVRTGAARRERGAGGSLGGPAEARPADAAGGGPGPRAGAGGAGSGGALGRREETERAFLSLCIASPEEGAAALAGLDVDAHFSGTLTRRAARYLRDGDLSAPMATASEGLDEDPELRALLAELIVQAGGLEKHPAMLEAQRLQLELARIDRDIQRARGRDDAAVSGLAVERGRVKHDFDEAYARVLDVTGAREG
jgi:DNA primase